MVTPNAPLPLIIVADDFEMVRQMLKCFLESSGYRVIEAANGREAVEIAGREYPDLILMNVSMPVMDGITATQRIHGIKVLGEVPIVAMSGEGTFHHDAALAAGCAAYLTKPIDLDALKRLLDQLLSGQPD